MRIKTQMNVQIAEELIEKFRALSDTEVSLLPVQEAVVYWYAVAYQNPGMHTDCPDTWGEFSHLGQRIIELYNNNAITDDQKYPYEATKAGVYLASVVIEDELCDYCGKAFLQGNEGNIVRDANGNVAYICDDCAL